MEDNTLNRECPHCHNVTVIKRAYRTYCAFCGWDASGDAIIKIPEAEQASPIDPQPVPQFSSRGITFDLTTLELIIDDLQVLSKKYSFTVPERVWQILSIAKEVIQSRSQKDESTEQ